MPHCTVLPEDLTKPGKVQTVDGQTGEGDEQDDSDHLRFQRHRLEHLPDPSELVRYLDFQVA